MGCDAGLCYRLIHLVSVSCLVRFLPVTPEVKSAYVQRVTSLAMSAGWRPAEPPSSAWTHDAFHSWSDREIEQPNEEHEKQEAIAQPARINFTCPSTAMANAN
jgi:hypothetical protein